MLTTWTDALCETYAGKQIAIDRKSLRGTMEAANGESAIQVVIAWVCEHQMVLGQLTAIPKLLDRLTLQGSTVTIDAMACQKGISKAIAHKRAYCIFLLKSNPPSLPAEVLASFDGSLSRRVTVRARN